MPGIPSLAAAPIAWAVIPHFSPATSSQSPIPASTSRSASTVTTMGQANSTAPGNYTFTSAGNLLPYAEGNYAVGCIAINVPGKTEGSVVPCHVFYPVSKDHAGEGERPAWLAIEYAQALGVAQLANTFTECGGVALMTIFGQAATGCLKLPTPIGAPPAPAPSAGWPCCIMSHSLTAWPLHQSAMALSIAGQGAVVVCPTHCDRTACVALTHGPGPQRLLATYLPWDKKCQEIRAALPPGASDDEVRKLGLAWRQSQNEQRLAELDASLDHLNATLAAARPDLFARPFKEGRPFARVRDNVAVVGMSFGGATAAAFALRDGSRAVPRVTHCFLLDPWIEQEDVSPLSAADLDRPLHKTLRTLRVWLDMGGLVAKTSAQAAETLVANAAKNAKPRTLGIVRVEGAGHYAQTDIPSVFEHGPLRCFYLALRGRAQNVDAAPPARETLMACLSLVLDALRDDGWVQVRQAASSKVAEYL